MREFVELRVPEECAAKLFAEHEGKKLDGVRKIIIETTDPRYVQIERAQIECRSKGSYFFSWFEFIRQYTKAEIECAELFEFDFTSAFEPTGEQCGTIYDSSAACPECGANAPQRTLLRLKKNSLPRSKDFSRTIAKNELLISRRAVDLFNEAGISGLAYLPVMVGQRYEEQSTEWFQMSFTETPLEISPETRFGLEIFGPDVKGTYVCPRGHTAGLNILSELYVLGSGMSKADFHATRQLRGIRRGLLRQWPLIVVSQKVRRLIEEHKLKGVRLDIAYVR